MSYFCDWSKYTHKTPTVVPSKFFLSSEDAEILWKALNTNKTDADAVVNVLAKRTLPQRLEIASEYKKLHGRDLTEDLKARLSSDFEHLIVALLTPLPEYYAEELKHAVEGLGTDEDDLIEILCTANNCEIKSIRRAYHSKYQRTLASDIKDDTSGYFRDLLVMVYNADRDRFPITDSEEARNAAKADAEALHAVKEQRWSTFSDVLCHRSYPQLVLIFEEFENLSGSTIERAIKDDFSGDTEKGLLTIVESIKNKAGFFARRLNESMKGLGTRDRDLIRIVATRSEIDMGDIKEEYERLYSKPLAAAIKDDTSGDYRKCLLVLIGEQ